MLYSNNIGYGAGTRSRMRQKTVASTIGELGRVWGPGNSLICDKDVFSVSIQCLKERFLCEQDLILTKFVDTYRSDRQVMSESESVVVNTV